MPEFQNDLVCLVTGGAGGIGFATAQRLLAAGVSAVIADRDAKRGAIASERLSAFGRVEFVEVDVSDEGSIANLISKVVAFGGRLDLAVNAAGIATFGTVLDTEIGPWQETLNVNLTGVFLCMKHEAPLMIKQGRGSIVNISSTGGVSGDVGVAAYVASKHGVNGLTKSAALELAPRGVRVNALCPGFTNTRMIADHLQAHEAQVLARIPLGRIAEPDDVAAAVIWLLSDDAGFVTGTEIIVDGGMIVR